MYLQKVVNFDGKRKEMFWNSNEFSEFRDVLDGEIKRLRRAGYGQSKRQAHALTETEEGKLPATLVLGEENLKLLLDTFVFLLPETLCAQKWR